MIRVMFVCACLAIWLLSCSTIGAAKESHDDFQNIWNPIITILNDTNHANIHHQLPYKIDIDLQQEYNREMELLSAQWQQQKGIDSEENEFFYNAIKKQNKDSSRLDRGAHVLSLSKTHGYSGQAAVNHLYNMATTILSMVHANPITSSNNIHKHIHGDQIGFCFARALLVHYLLLKSGIAPSNIIKVFAFGDFKMSYYMWHFHVAVMIANKNDFLVIDPLFPRPMPYEEWMENVSALEIKHPNSRARFYVTDARKFLPSSGAYSIELLSHELLKDYFYQLGKTIP